MVWAQKDLKWTLPIHNGTSSGIDIEHLSASCGCASLVPKTCSLRTSETISVEMTLDLFSRSSPQKAESCRDFSTTVFAHLTEPIQGDRRVFSWDIHGRVLFPFVISSPASAIDGQTVIAGDPSAPWRIDLSLLHDVVSLDAECDESQATVRVQTSPKKERDVTLVVELNENLPVGAHRISVALTPIRPNDHRLPRIPIQLPLTVLSEVEASPPVLSLGTLPVGSSVNQTVTLCSRTGRPFEILRAECDDPGVSITPSSGSTKTMHATRVTFAIRVAGAYSRFLRFLVKPEDSKDAFVVVVRILAVGSDRSLDARKT